MLEVVTIDKGGDKWLRWQPLVEAVNNTEGSEQNRRWRPMGVLVTIGRDSA